MGSLVLLDDRYKLLGKPFALGNNVFLAAYRIAGINVIAGVPISSVVAVKAEPPLGAFCWVIVATARIC